VEGIRAKARQIETASNRNSRCLKAVDVDRLQWVTPARQTPRARKVARMWAGVGQSLTTPGLSRRQIAQRLGSARSGRWGSENDWRIAATQSLRYDLGKASLHEQTCTSVLSDDWSIGRIPQTHKDLLPMLSVQLPTTSVSANYAASFLYA